MKRDNVNNRESDAQTAEELVQYVTFLVAGETYGVSVQKVQSINEMVDITYVPHSRSYIEGVINLRGSVVPVINMRKKFALPVKEYDQFTVILIVEVKGRLIGMIADSVSDVVSIPVSGIQKDIQFSARVDTASLEGIGQIDDQLIVLLNVDYFLDTEKSGE